MSKITSYKELIVWQRAMQALVMIRDLVNSFPINSQYGIGREMKRSVVSVASNIAEGWGRVGDKSFHYSLTVARGSNYELETQTIGASMLKLVEKGHKIFGLIEEVSKMLNALISKIEKDKSIKKTLIANFYLL
ncbi:MAG: four helix bundle protein [Bacteroidia bacterium]